MDPPHPFRGVVAPHSCVQPLLSRAYLAPAFLTQMTQKKQIPLQYYSSDFLSLPGSFLFGETKGFGSSLDSLTNIADLTSMSLPPTTQSQILKHYFFFKALFFIKSLSCVHLFATPWTIVVFQARILESPFPSPRDLPNPGIEPRSPSLQVHSLPAVNPSFCQQMGVAGTQEKATKKGTI